MKYGKIFVVLGLAIMMSGCSNASYQAITQEANDQVQNQVQKDNKYVLMVKQGHNNQYPDQTYEEAFESFFGSPTWKYFKADTGEDVVEFTGECMYQDVQVKARLQFIVDEDAGTFEAGALTFNDVPQSQLITGALLQKAFGGDTAEEYEEAEETQPLQEFLDMNEEQSAGEEAAIEDQGEVQYELTENEAVQLVLNYLKANGDYIPAYVEVDHEEDTTYTVHAYDIIENEEGGHTATVGWYDVDKMTGEVSSMFD